MTWSRNLQGGEKSARYSGQPQRAEGGESTAGRGNRMCKGPVCVLRKHETSRELEPGKAGSDGAGEIEKQDHTGPVGHG